ncbi:hypothetical protein RHMOL_Rhmol13G0284900 [Rhododendron molle]|uniref:Uncharacterized protein n=1 Tax=Rhododendron molle TaxID=49168 RepID=A0ACC0LCZ3_RHOML|nr:hypothetical protein RHMOL_Rhmol13G0284900 [Rhododendron molle]
MCLNSAVQLGIPDIIHNCKQPITLAELVSSLHLPPEKTNSLYRLLRLLVHLGFFATAKFNTNEGDLEGYVLTPSSRLLVKSEITNFSPFVRAMVDPVMVTPWQSLGDWFHGSEKTAFETAHGVEMWEFCDQNPKFSHTFSEAMASDSTVMNHLVGECKAVFQGLNSLVDVGGGTGTTFQALDDWSDEDCVKIPKRCKEAIPSKDNGGKVIIMDIVMDRAGDGQDAAEAKAYS